MKPKRSLRDVFNLKGLRRATLTVAAAMAMGAGCVAETHPYVKINPPPPVVTGCAPDTARPKLPYDEELFRQNDDNAPSKAVLAMTGDQRIQYYMDKFCFTAGTAANDNNPRDQAIVSALNTLNGVTFMGKPLVDLADDSHLRFCALKHMPAGAAAQYLVNHDFVAAGQNGRKQGQVLDIAHEITHAAQGRHGLLTYDLKWDIQSRVRRNLVIEAAPVALEFSVAYEKKLAGDSSYWEYLKKHDANTAYTSPDSHALFEKTYQDSIAAGAGENTALHAAAHKIFERVFDSDDWRRFYLTSELNSYVEDIAAGKFKTLAFIQHDAFGQDRVDLAGQIGDLPSYTKDGQVPAYAEFFRGDQKMQWAYEAADIARHRQQLGAEASLVKDMEALAAAGKNPYYGLDFDKLCRRVQEARWKGNFKPTWQLMDEQLQDRSTPAPANANCAPEPAAAKPASTPRAAF